jgi:transketolase
MNTSLDSDQEIKLVEKIAFGIRRRVLGHTIKKNGGYLSQACSSAEIIASLYGSLVQLAPLDHPLPSRDFIGVPGPQNPGYITGAEFHGMKGSNFDRLIISPAHYALVVYAALIETKRLTEGSLENFNRDGSTIEMIGGEHSPGFESTTGSLGQALSQSGGIALARKLKGDDGLTWVFMSDGEFQEGQTWEALANISFHNLNSIKVIVDVNGSQVDGLTKDIMSIEPLSDRVEAFGWEVDAVDGHDIQKMLMTGRKRTYKPHMILAYTSPTRGLDVLADRHPLYHYIRFTNDEERKIYQDLLESMEL